MASAEPFRPPSLPAHRLLRWQRLSLYATGALLILTGIVWLVLHYSVEAGAMPPPLEAWVLRLHGLAAFAGLFVLGVLAAAHVPQGWRLSLRHGWPGQRRTGLLLCIVGALLVLTGYLLYYFAPETLRPALGWAHAAIGLAMALLVVSHRRGV